LTDTSLYKNISTEVVDT